jgi:type IV pilus assembly protein PilW
MNGGWTLAELMVALAVGAIVSLFAAGLMAAANAGLAAQADRAALDDAGRYVLATVGRAVRQAGWNLPAEAGLDGSEHALAIRYAGAADGSILNCAGAAEEGAVGWSVFRLEGDALRCRYRTGHSWSAQTMAVGVREFQLAYGVDLDHPRDGIANRWMAADEVVEWQRVVSVRLAFVLQGRHGRQAFAMTYRRENPS